MTTRAETEPASGGELAGADIVRDTSDEAPIIVTGSREQLFHLLAEASEIEHCLMCSYLYAAFSLKRDTIGGVSDRQAKAIARWRKAIMGVAIEEMGHLLILANLVTALGGRPHFGRPNFPVAPGYFPSGIVVRLSGFSFQTLDHFIFLERPKGACDEDAEQYAQEDYTRRQAHLGLMPNTQHYSTIGFLYEAIRENLVALAATYGEAALFMAGDAAQLIPPLIDLPGVERITSLRSALAGIDLIVEQGEGSPQDREGTHYRTFLGVRQHYQSMIDEDPAFEPAWPVADNPVLRSPPEPEGKTFIDHPEAAPLLDFTCAIYGLLLRLLAQCFGDRKAAEAPRQEKFLGAAFELMHMMDDCSAMLAELPASLDRPNCHAGMSFTMLRGVEPLLSGATGERLLAEQVQRLAHGADRIAHLPHTVRSRIEALLREA